MQLNTTYFTIFIIFICASVPTSKDVLVVFRRNSKSNEHLSSCHWTLDCHIHDCWHLDHCFAYCYHRSLLSVIAACVIAVSMRLPVFPSVWSLIVLPSHCNNASWFFHGQHRASQRSVGCIIMCTKRLFHSRGWCWYWQYFCDYNIFLPICWLSHVCRYWDPGTRGAEQIIVCRHSAQWTSLQQLWTSLQQYWSVNIATTIENITKQQLWTSPGNNCEHHYNNPSTFIVHIEHAHVHIYVQVLCQLNVEGITDQIIVCWHSALWTSLQQLWTLLQQLWTSIGNNCEHNYATIQQCEHCNNTTFFVLCTQKLMF